jgi:hypothetical protein
VMTKLTTTRIGKATQSAAMIVVKNIPLSRSGAQRTG